MAQLFFSSRECFCGFFLCCYADLYSFFRSGDFMQLNFNNQKNQLTFTDIDQLVALITHRCRAKTVSRVRSILTYSPSLIPEYGILARLIKEGEGWDYVAGQDYSSEIKTVRECILKG